MTQAVTVRRDGDAFQARLFWLHAARLLDPLSPVGRVGFEVGPRGFDDVWIEYDPDRGGVDQHGRPLRREHLQCKWHATPGSYGHADLTEPDFINANARSLLQRARQAQTEHAPDGAGVRFKLVTNWQIDRADPLREMIGTRSGAMRVDRLYGSRTDESRAGRVRKAWRDHLGIEAEELKKFAGTLAFGALTDTLEELRERLDILFAYVGLARVPAASSAFPYDDLVFQWAGQRRLLFDRGALRDACRREGLLERGPEARPLIYGMKSFEHPFDRLEERCSKVLDLVPWFDERFIRDDADWEDTLLPALRKFLAEAAGEAQQIRLVLDAHASLAFAAGTVINLKAGRRIELEQRSNGLRVWSADDRTTDPNWDGLAVEIVDLPNGGGDLAVALGITHDVEADVRRHLEANLVDAGRLIVLKPAAGPGANAVVCGRHASQLADAAVAAIREAAAGDRPAGVIHLFAAAPNALTFFLGQRQPALGRVRVYEFDFEGGRGRSYAPSLTLPPGKPAGAGPKPRRELAAGSDGLVCATLRTNSPSAKP
ncbi:MAG TPA: SAVED domain-containing protein [Allosphingosinicella sp.]